MAISTMPPRAYRMLVYVIASSSGVGVKFDKFCPTNDFEGFNQNFLTFTVSSIEIPRTT